MGTRRLTPWRGGRFGYGFSASFRCLDRDEFDFEAVVVLQVGGIVLCAAGVGVPIGEHQMPAVLSGVGRQLLDRGRVFDVEGQMVQSGAAAVVPFGGQGVESETWSGPPTHARGITFDPDDAFLEQHQ
ncbi:hypothetical protein [Streptomyces griseorubiginosus]